MIVLVAGGSGFIGHHLIGKLIANGHDVWNVDERIISNKRLLSITDSLSKAMKTPIYGSYGGTIHYDVAKKLYNHALMSLYPDVIVYLASTPEARNVAINYEDGLGGIMLGPINLITTFVDIKRFIYISSSMVYGNFGNHVPEEKDLRKPTEPYGILKSAAEDIVKFYTKDTTEYTIIRPSAVYGPRDKIQRVISKFIRAAELGEPLEVKGNNSLDFTYIDDLVDGLALCIDHPEAANETFNMTRGQAVLLGDAAQCVVDTVGKGEIFHYNHDPLYPVRGALNINKAKILLGYNPKVDLKEGIEKYWNEW